jgi:hypothetical protein
VSCLHESPQDSTASESAQPLCRETGGWACALSGRQGTRDHASPLAVRAGKFWKAPTRQLTREELVPERDDLSGAASSRTLAMNAAILPPPTAGGRVESDHREPTLERRRWKRERIIVPLRAETSTP